MSPQETNKDILITSIHIDENKLDDYTKKWVEQLKNKSYQKGYKAGKSEIALTELALAKKEDGEKDFEEGYDAGYKDGCIEEAKKCEGCRIQGEEFWKIHKEEWFDKVMAVLNDFNVIGEEHPAMKALTTLRKEI